MEQANSNKIISLKITKSPQHLLIPSVENTIVFQAINYLNYNANFKFIFEGENLNVIFPDELEKEPILFGPGETKNLEIKVTPTTDGYGKLSVLVNLTKFIQYTVKVQKVRDVVPKKRINKILRKHTLGPTISKDTDAFNPNNFIIQMTMDVIKKAEKELESKKKEFKSLEKLIQTRLASPEINIREIEYNKKQVLEEIENYIKQLAKGYLYNKNPQKALKLVTELSDVNEKGIFYNNLIRAYTSINLNEALQIIKNLTDQNRRFALIKNLVFDQLNTNLEQASKIAFLIEDQRTRKNLIRDMVGKTIDLNPNFAFKLSNLIDEDYLKINILFNIIKKLHEQNNKSEQINVLNHIINSIVNSSKLNLKENNYKNPAYKNLKDAIQVLAEIDFPQAANSIILAFNLEELKEKITEDLFDVIYEMVDEIRTKVELTPVFSQYYLFNTYTSNITNDITNFSLLGGNVSNNILVKNFNFNVAFISLFSYDFSIFPIIDRVYTDLKFNINKSIAYYVFPSYKNHNEAELQIINNTLKQFFSNLANVPSQVLVFNLDFIPYLGKPTIIISSETELNQYINSKINKAFGDTVNLIIDNNLFKDGFSTDNLKQIFPPYKCKIANLILSYEFIYDYNIFKTFIQSLI